MSVVAAKDQMMLQAFNLYEEVSFFILKGDNTEGGFQMSIR